MKKAECAQELGISIRTLTNWVSKHGCPRNSDGSYDIDEVRQWADTMKHKLGRRGRAHGDVRAPGGYSVDAEEVEDVREELLLAKLRKELAQAEKHELDVQERRKLLISAQEAAEHLQDCISRAKSVLLGGPATLAPDLVGLEVRDIQETLEAWVYTSLKELSGD